MGRKFETFKSHFWHLINVIKISHVTIVIEVNHMDVARKVYEYMCEKSWHGFGCISIV
jgi:hypothetical protein